MAASSVMTVRLDPELLRSLKARAQAEGRTVSSQVVHLLRREFAPEPAVANPGGSALGMFSAREVVEVSDVRALRRTVTSRATRKRTVR